MTRSALFTAAWNTARAAAAKFGGSARQFFALSLKAAYAATRAPLTLEAMAAKVGEMDTVSRASVWDGRRVYVNFVGADRAKAGDRNLKVFWSPKTGWVIDGVKGCMSNAMRSSAVKFCRALNIAVTF